VSRFAFPQYTLGERVADGTIHVISVTASLAALIALLVIGIHTHMLSWALALTIYGVALVATFGFSAGYHLVGHPGVKEVLRRFDHAAIFLMIAGTYTPFVLIKLLLPRFLDGLSTALYLVQGWAVLAAWEPLRSALPGGVLMLLMVGGVLYTIGVVFHLWNRLPYQNAIWHGFVLSAASCHYAAVLGMVRV
jgi:hemolysin III